MSEFSWGPEVVDEARADEQPEHSVAEPSTVALSMDDFAALEDRILRAVNLVKREKLARAAAEERATQAEAKVAEQTPVTEQLQKDVSSLRAERDHVRQRVEKLLAQLDALEL